jgi:hypothetical protein
VRGEPGVLGPYPCAAAGEELTDLVTVVHPADAISGDRVETGTGSAWFSTSFPTGTRSSCLMS